MQKRYQVIYSDPPWEYNARNNLNTKFSGGAYGQYDLMSMAELARLPMQNIADTSCLMFLWCTFPKLEQQLEVMRAWGFEYKTVAFTWIKLNPVAKTPFFGVGYYTKSNAEICLLGVRGKTIKPATDKISSLIVSRRRKHSAKPVEAIKRITAMYPTQDKIELFARSRYPGWDSTGLELDGVDIRDFLNNKKVVKANA